MCICVSVIIYRMSFPSNNKGEHYNLRWNNYYKNLVQVFSELKYREQLVDVTLLCEGQAMKAHKIILAACSGFFMDLFQNSKDIHPVITFYEMNFSNLKQIIHFIYQGEVKVPDVDLEGVLNLGEKFQVKGLSSVKLKHKVSPAGENIFEEIPIKYKVNSIQKCDFGDNQNLTETTATDATPAEDIPQDVDNIIEPIKKKARVDMMEKHLSNFENEEARPTEENKLKNSNWDNDSNVSSVPETNYIGLLKTNVKQSDKNNLQINRSEYINVNQHIRETNSLPKEGLKDQDQLTESASNELSNDLSEKPNAFIIFSKEWRKKLKVEHPDEDFKNISVRLGNLWKSLTSETRESYYMVARQAQLCSQHYKSEL